MNFKGTAKRLDDVDLPKLGKILGVGEDELHAFIDVETRGSGFDEQGRPRILFERHKFYKYLPKSKRAEAVKAGLASTTAGGYGKESDQYPKLERAMKIDQKAALYACSWGLGQIMGFNHALAGYDTVEAMIESFKEDEENHLASAVAFIKNTGLDDELRAHRWAAFAKGYNGVDYKRNRYDEKLAEAFRKWSRIKDTPPDAPEPEIIVTEPPVAKPEPDVIVVQDNPKPSWKIPRGTKGLSILGAIIMAIFTWFSDYFSFFGG